MQGLTHVALSLPPSRLPRLFACVVAIMFVGLAAPPSARPGESAQETRPIAQEQAGSTKAYLVLAKGPIDDGLARDIRQALERAGEAGAEVVILEIDTFGGEMEAAVTIRDALLDAPLRTVAFINKRAISAGALVALATHDIVMAPGATIGAATPLRLTWTGAEPAGEKAISYFRKEMKATAESREHPAELAEAMVDPDVVVEGVVEKGKLLTLTTQEALKLKLAGAESENLDRLLAAYGLELLAESREEASRVRERLDAEGWFDRVRAWHIWVILGLLFAVAEIVVPGFFLLWFAVGAFLASFLAFLGFSRNVQLAAFLVSSFLLLVFSRTIFKSVLLRSSKGAATNIQALQGRKGIVLKPVEGSLKPGLVKIGGEEWSAVCEDETRIDNGAKVEVLEVVGNKVRIKQV